MLRDPTITRRRKIAPVVAIVYLSSPIDLIPDFIPVLGQLDNALVIAWTLRHIIESAGRERVEAALERRRRQLSATTTTIARSM